MFSIKKVTPLGWVVAAVITGEILFFMPSPLKETKGPPVTSTAIEASLSIEGFHAVNLNEEGQKETIDAIGAELYRKEGYVILKDVEAKIYSQANHVIHIQGEKGKYYLEAKDLEFFENIVVTSENLGYQLKTNYLKYEDQKKMFSTDDTVWIAGPNPQSPSLELTGKGLKGNTKAEEMTLLSQVHCKKYDEKADSIEIDSDKADIFFNKNEALFKKNVVVKQKEMNIFTEHFLVRFNRRNKSMDTAKAFDEVKIVHGERIGTCKNAFLLNREQKIVMTGEPKVMQGDDVVKGKIIIFLLKENKIIFDEAVGEVKGLQEKGLDGIGK